MRKTLNEVQYVIQMPVDEFIEKVTGTGDDDKDAEVHNAISELPGVSEVEFDNHFGPNVYVTIEADRDDEYLWKKIWKIIGGTDDGTC